MWRWVVSSLVGALTCCIPLVAEALLGVCLYCQIKASHMVDLEGVETNDGC